MLLNKMLKRGYSASAPLPHSLISIYPKETEKIPDKHSTQRNRKIPDRHSALRYRKFPIGIQPGEKEKKAKTEKTEKPEKNAPMKISFVSFTKIANFSAKIVIL